jgi:hypothetical protein
MAVGLPRRVPARQEMVAAREPPRRVLLLPLMAAASD